MWVIYIKDEPFAKLQVKGGPQTKMYLMQGRDKDGKPFFEDHLAYPTSPGNYYIFKKTDHYLSNIYRPTTMVPMGEIIAKGEDKKWYFRNKRGKWKPVHSVLQADLKQAPGEWKYIYYDPVRNASGEVTQVRWGSHPFGKYAIQISVDNKSMHPELIHSSGDLIMEERRLIDDLIKIFSAPHDNLDECVAYSHNFDLYKSCYDFVNDPTREDLIQVPERLYYKLYFNLPLSSQEVAGLPQDVVIADKILKKKGSLTREETKILINEGIAYRRAGKLKINMQKILGLQFDVYQYVVAVQKYAHHYGTLKKHWKELTALRRALLKDIKNFVIKDPKLLHDFTRELMLKRTRLEKLSQQNAIEILKEMLELER